MIWQWALIFLIVSILAGIFGFSGVAADSAWMAKVLFFISLILLVVSLIM